ncbi:MAG: DmsC/YnfH family molybdoenzyme membrane anchor subunit [Raoultibacter sp.]
MAVQWPLLIFSVLLGITSGIFVFLGVGEVKGKFKNVRFIAALIGLICLAVGGCVSVLHMGHPERAAHLLGNLGSGLSKELFITAAMGIVAFIYLILAKKDYPQASKITGIIAAVLGLVLAPITGASYLIAARPAWDSVTLPLMYLGAGLAMGFLLVCALVLMRERAEEEGGFALKLALFGVIVMAVSVVAYLIWVAVAPYQAPSRSIMRLVSGDMALAFWLGAILIGLVAPVALTSLACVKATKGEGATGLADPKKLAYYIFAAFACAVVGSVVLRVLFYGLGTCVQQLIYK